MWKVETVHDGGGTSRDVLGEADSTRDEVTPRRKS